MLELEFVELSESRRAFEIGRLPFLFKLDFFTEGIFQSALDQLDREIGDVDSNPLSIQLLCCVNRRPASAKRIEHNIAGIARRADDAFEKCERFLRGKIEALH